MDQDNLCYRGDDCEQANQGQQIVGKDNDAKGFNDQSDNLALSTSATGNGTTPPPTPSPNGTLTVVKEVECDSNNGNPSNDEVCAFAENSDNFPQPSDYPITVDGNGPTPPSFQGSSTGTPVTIGSGAYTVDEELASTAAIQTELSATSVITTTTASGDCTPNLGPNMNFLYATGTMTPGGSQTCTLVNTVTINGGTVPPSG
jgi:hypothetical protein